MKAVAMIAIALGALVSALVAYFGGGFANQPMATAIDLSTILRSPAIDSYLKLPSNAPPRLDPVLHEGLNLLLVAPSCASCSARKFNLKEFLSRCRTPVVVLLDRDASKEIGDAKILRRHIFIFDPAGKYMTAQLANMAPALLVVDAQSRYKGAATFPEFKEAKLLEEERK